MERLAFVERLKRKPVIGGMKQGSDLQRAIDQGVEVFFILTGTIFDLEVKAAQIKEHGRLVLAHVDLLEGIGRDASGIRFLAKRLGVDGVLSTRNAVIRAAKDEGLLAVQRLFLLDSEAVRTALTIAERSNPDAVEVLPGLIIPSIIHRLPTQNLPPLIAGGLVETRAEVKAILQSGAVAVSTSREELWGYPEGR
jgi:glycerol uptake operon antiterminator